MLPGPGEGITVEQARLLPASSIKENEARLLPGEGVTEEEEEHSFPYFFN